MDIRELDITRFWSTVQAIVTKHPILRSKLVGTQLVVDPQFCFSASITCAIDLEARRRACMDVFMSRPDLFWDINVSQLSGGVSRVHILFDMTVIDASSIGLLASDLVAVYVGLDLGSVPQLSFRSFVEQPVPEKLKSLARDYWMPRLATIPGPPELARPWVLPATRGLFFERAEAMLDQKDWNRLRRHGAQLSVGPTAVLAGVLFEALSFHCDGSQFTITMTTSDRSAAFEDVVGDFTNAILCSMRSERGGPIGALIQTVSQDIMEAVHHSRAVSGPRLVGMLRECQNSPDLIFPVVLTSTVDAPPLPPHILEVIESGQIVGGFSRSRTPHVTLDIQTSQTSDGALQIVMDFDPFEHDPAVIDQLLLTYRSLLLQLASASECDINDVRLQPPATALPEMPKRTFTQSSLLHELVLEAARLRPAKVAVVDQAVQLTFNQLILMAQAGSALLVQCNAQGSVPIAIVCEKGWEQVVSALSITTLGAHYLPINPSAPDNHILAILTTAEVKIATCQERTREGRTWVQEGLHAVVYSMETLSDTSPPQCCINVDPDATAYIIFTSGSTGKPKGVVISHHGAVNTCLDINERFVIGESDAGFGLSSLAFDLSVYDVFGTLMAGATLVICKPDGTRDPDYWWQQLCTHNVTVWNSVPAMFEMLLEVKPAHVHMPLKTVMLSGDAIRMDFADRTIRSYHEMRLIALGGATEASIWSNYHEVLAHSKEFGTTLVPYGRGLSNQVLYVLDDQLENRPLGAIGQIFIGGIGVAKGYFGQPELTARSFIVHPALGRVYATGDVGRYLSNGEIEILGRKDGQVKVGGNRVELGHIESVIERLDSIKKAAVTLNPNGQLVAFLISHEGQTPAEHVVRSHVVDHLPDYMHPQNWYFTASIPLSGNGKVDRNALKALARNPQSSTSVQAIPTAASGPVDTVRLMRY